MTYCFEPVAFVPTTVVLASLAHHSFFSERDACWLVRVGCFNCGGAFLEELETARQKVLCCLPLLCLSCDPEAEEPVPREFVDKLGSVVE